MIIAFPRSNLRKRSRTGRIPEAARLDDFIKKALERVKGIEPSSSAWKAVALPLSYTRIAVHHTCKRTAFPDIAAVVVGEVGLEPTKA
jgi:hypothetical protein